MLLAALSLAACGVECPDGPWRMSTEPCEAIVAGACVVARPGLRDIQPARLEAAVRDGVAFWGAPPTVAAGWTIAVSPGSSPPPCSPGSDACAALQCGWIYLPEDPLGPGRPDCAEWALPHEIGHLVLGAGHDDPRWMDVPYRCWGDP